MVGLGHLPGGSFSSIATGLSADGSVVVGHDFVSPFSRPFRWTAGTGMQDILPANVDGEAYGCSANGSVIVGQSFARACRWTAATGAVDLGDLPGGGTSSLARAVSADGSAVAGQGQSGDGNEAFRWTAATGMAGIGMLGPGIAGSNAFAISADGAVIAGESVDAFRWTAGTGITSIGVPPGSANATAMGVSGDGSIVVGTGNWLAEQETAFIWDAQHGTRSLKTVLETDSRLDLTGWELNRATAISPDGRPIVGEGRNPQGNIEAFLVSTGAVLDVPLSDRAPGTRPRLTSAFPNPFRTITTLEFTLPAPERVRLGLFDIHGRAVGTLLDGWMPSGVHRVEFNAEHYPPGIYFSRLVTSREGDWGKIVVAR